MRFAPLCWHSCHKNSLRNGRTLNLGIKGWIPVDEFCNLRMLMKNKSFIAIILLALVGALAVPSVRAQTPEKEKSYSKKTLEKYDTDKDGKLSPDEVAAMKADKKKAKAEHEAQKNAAKSPAPEEKK